MKKSEKSVKKTINKQKKIEAIKETKKEVEKATEEREENEKSAKKAAKIQKILDEGEKKAEQKQKESDDKVPNANAAKQRRLAQRVRPCRRDRCPSRYHFRGGDRAVRRVTLLATRAGKARAAGKV
mgnify:CR=1 FL=1